MRIRILMPALCVVASPPLRQQMNQQLMDCNSTWLPGKDSSLVMKDSSGFNWTSVSLNRCLRFIMDSCFLWGCEYCRLIWVLVGLTSVSLNRHLRFIMDSCFLWD